MNRSRAPVLLLVTPYLADANNGNWRTAARWARLLAPHYRVIVQAPGDPLDRGRAGQAVAMIALHARRSHEAIVAWRRTHGDRPLVVVLTGTDLYRDLPAVDGNTLSSLAFADRLIVLQEDAMQHLPPSIRDKAVVVFQSARRLVRWPGKSCDRLHCVLVAHLREEKDPATLFAAWRLLRRDAAVTLTVIGAALDPALGVAARDLAASDPRVQWLGPRAHAWTRQAVKRAHVLIVPSRMEGGANVVVEAVTAGTAVIASRVSGNVGMLGREYPGYFEAGDAAGLASLLTRIDEDRTFLGELEDRCHRRASTFEPEAEAQALRGAIAAACASRVTV